MLRFVTLRLIRLRFETLTLCDILFCVDTFKDKDVMRQSRRIRIRYVAAPLNYR